MIEATPGPVIANAILSALRDPGFAAGVAFAFVAFAVVAAATLAMPRGGRDVVVPVGGLCFVAASLLALLRNEGVSDRLVWGIAALVGAGAVSSLARGRLPGGATLLGAALAVPGAWLVVHAEPIQPIGWIQLLLGVGIVVGGALAADFDRRWRRVGAPPVLLAISLFGVYVTVPDTEQALVVLGASLPLALPGAIGWPRALNSLGSAGAFGAVGLLAWTVGAGGAARHSAIVGGLACLGLFVVEPVGRALAGGRSRILGAVPDRRIWALAAVAAGHLALVYVCARMAGLRDTVAVAGWIAGGALLLAVAALSLGEPNRDRDRTTERARA
jgi:hypothetical protein